MTIRCLLGAKRLTTGGSSRLRAKKPGRSRPGAGGGFDALLGTAMDDKETLKNEVSLQPFEPKRDRALLAKWLHAPHVVRWWGNPKKTIQEVLVPARGGGDALIVVGFTPVGYLRWQVPTPAELPAAGWHDIPEDAVDIDIAIGEPHDLGGGVASQALRLLIERLRLSTAVSMIIIIGTSVENRRAIRAYQRAGFERDRVFDDPELGRRWLCVVKPAPNRFNADRLFRRAPRPAG